VPDNRQAAGTPGWLLPHIRTIKNTCPTRGSDRVTQKQFAGQEWVQRLLHGNFFNIRRGNGIFKKGKARK
jgi:hypothetical protein